MQREGADNCMYCITETYMAHRTQSDTATKLIQLSKVSKDSPKYKFGSLASLLNEEYLRTCYAELPKKKALGIDGVSVEEYGESLEANLNGLVERMKSMSYRPQAVRKKEIPKERGGTRILGIPSAEDKIVQKGISSILTAIFDPSFIETSYGFREKMGCHDALKMVHQEITFKRVNYIIDADIKSFFDNVDHDWLVQFLEHRIKDKKFIRLIIRFLKAGIMDEGILRASAMGTPQGGIISPILANIYLHYVLDLWFEKGLKKELQGYASIVRYADDFIILVERESDCTLILEQLRLRLAKFKLELSESKTSVVKFGRNTDINDERKHPDTFDFLGFTHYCGKTRDGKFKVCRRTSKSRFRLGIRKVSVFLKEHKNTYTLQELWASISQMVRGHYRYYGVSDNSKSLWNYQDRVKGLLYKWLNRRSQMKSYTWESFKQYVSKYPLPEPKIYVSFYKH
jgi:RNA-directed DNA polymerase